MLLGQLELSAVYTSPVNVCCSRIIIKLFSKPHTTCDRHHQENVKVSRNIMCQHTFVQIMLQVSEIQPEVHIFVQLLGL